ncbi:hypothetical protein DZB83_25710 [Bacillus sp. dmp10]|nr:hypothetical protein DZB83_25710 [Bacillus sp. dmp10]
MKVGTYFIVKNAELSTDTFKEVPTFLSIYRDKKMGTSLNEDTKVVTFPIKICYQNTKTHFKNVIIFRNIFHLNKFDLYVEL